MKWDLYEQAILSMLFSIGLENFPADKADERNADGADFSANICGKQSVSSAGNYYIYPMTENEISYQIRGCIFTVYNKLGPGLLESAYSAALQYELEKAMLQVSAQVPMQMIYETIRMEVGYRLDLLVESKVIIEIKSVETLLDVHHKQLITYLKLSGCKLGILVNFNTDHIANSIFRKVNGL